MSKKKKNIQKKIQSNIENKRNEFLDIVKCICIISVIIGHCIQYGSGSTYLENEIFFKNPIFIFIYSFHMPLFMLISGYLFGYSINKKNWKELLITKFKQLLIPLCTWSFITLLIEIFKILLKVSNERITCIWTVKKFVSGFILGPWFLWAVWWCSFIVIIVKTFFKDNIIIYLFGTILTFIIPDILNLSLYKFMWPFFLLAYLYNNHDYKIKFQNISKNKLFITGIMFIFILLLLQFNYDSYIYTSGYTIINKNILKQISINIYRFLTGMTGSISIMYILYYCSKKITPKSKKYIIYIGNNTLGVYIISGILFGILNNITSNMKNINYLYTAIETLCILSISIIITIILKKYKITNKLFLGGR